ncbi:MAG: hypothetical protein WBI19_05220, partial [Prolixibacteraceae bacterium]
MKPASFQSTKTSNTSKNPYHQILLEPSKNIVKYIAREVAQQGIMAGACRVTTPEPSGSSF